MLITSQVFEDFLKCPTKIWLRSNNEIGTGNSYFYWLRNQQNEFRTLAAKKLDTLFYESNIKVNQSTKIKLNTSRYLYHNYIAKSDSLESSIDAFESISNQQQTKHSNIIIFRFVVKNKITKEDKIILAYNAFVLSEMLHCKIEFARIIHGDDLVTSKVDILSLMPEVRKIIRQIKAFISSTTAPELFLNRHCQECEFQSICKKAALEKDDLSLLGGIKEKECRRLRLRGIFTISQLSHTFRAKRKSKKQLASSEKYHHASQSTGY